VRQRPSRLRPALARRPDRPGVADRGVRGHDAGHDGRAPGPARSRAAGQDPGRDRPGPPIWVASWGSAAGLRRVARLGDGWLASAYNTTPERYRQGLDRLAGELARAGRTAEPFPVAIATTFLHVSEDRGEAERILGDVLAPMLGRPAELCAERLAAWAEAGARRIFVWPIGDKLEQLELFRERVVSLAVSRPRSGTR
jgi:alkanesulfonate monooxygenase SsuD/methylene tetrahydromethanopterin reductase-like flavin-dependent oxidoreductase (luciferase family)